jgi:NhaA family Na+:H+ antiporter
MSAEGVTVAGGRGAALRTPPIERLLRPFREFAHLEASGGVVLLAATALALVWANSPWAWAYYALWHTPVTAGAGDAVLTQDVQHWINDGLMVLFFFVVGLEIKREVLVGELASARRAALPAAAALGGMLLPAGIFALLNAGGRGAPGWGVPMATDIAFALGILALLGRRVPLALKVFLTALAVIDDIGAVLVIALFYTPSVSWTALAAAAACLALLVGVNRLGVRTPVVYAILGIVLWLAVLLSGVHATVAGVLLAATIPARTRIDPSAFLARGRAFLGDFAAAAPEPAAGPALALAPGRSGPRFITEGQQTAVLALEEACEHVQTPLHRLEHALHPWVAFAIMPLFALANAGVSLSAEVLARAVNPVTLGVFAGLVVGKQVGITGAAWLATRTGIAALPAGVSWRQIYGAAWLGGIGFTMSLFIAALAFEDEPTLAAAKIGILGASLVAGVTGWAILRAAPARSGSGSEVEAEGGPEGEGETEGEREGEGAGAVKVG